MTDRQRIIKLESEIKLLQQQLVFVKAHPPKAASVTLTEDFIEQFDALKNRRAAP